MSESRQFPYSTRARVTLAIARAVAASRGERDLTPLHVALGLLQEGQNAAVGALHVLGVDLARFRRDAELALGAPTPGGTRPDEVTIPLSPGEARQIDAAKRTAAGLGDVHVGPEHLLLAILDDPDARVSALLAQYGVTFDTASAALTAIIHKH